MLKKTDNYSKDDKKRQPNMPLEVNINNININFYNCVIGAPPMDDDTKDDTHQHSLTNLALTIISILSDVPGLLIFLQMLFQFLQSI